MEWIKKFLVEESGASSVEYALFLALIALAIVGAVSTLGKNISTIFTNDTLTNALRN
jgi:pilus assembly protein Flp/PilA